MLMLPLDKLNGWLFGVSVLRVKPELRERLTQYQAECFDVLARHFLPAQPQTEKYYGQPGYIPLPEPTLKGRRFLVSVDGMGREHIEILTSDVWVGTPGDMAGALIAGKFSRPELLAIANASAQRLYMQSCTDGPKGIGAQVTKLINRDLSQTDLREIVTSATLELWMRAMPEKS